MGRKVALFITCLTDQFYPRVGVAVTKILERYGCEVTFPDAQTCCGQPFFNNGFHDEAAGLARRWIDVFQPYEFIVTPSGSCCAMVREHFHQLIKSDSPTAAAAEATISKTYEFVEFLNKVLKVDLSNLKLRQPTRTTYHFTCHLRGIGLKDESIGYLKQMGNVDLVPLEKSDQCCGFGGTFAVKYPAISGAIVEDKVRCIEQTGASVTICNDAGCTMNIAGMCHRSGVKSEVKHIAELIAEAMDLNLETW